MTKTEREMNSGYYAEGAYDTEREARATAFDIEQSGQATWVRKAAHGWTVWVETDNTNEKRTMAAS